MSMPPEPPRKSWDEIKAEMTSRLSTEPQDKDNANSNPSAKASIPGWVWLFIGLNLILGMIGGAIGGGFAGLGVASCVAIARDRTTSLVLRVIACMSVTILCWVLAISVIIWMTKAMNIQR